MPKTVCGQPVPRATAQDRQGRPYILPNGLAMLGEDVDRRGGSSQRPAGAAWGQGVLVRGGTIVRKAVTGGTLAIRLLATGILLVIGLPLLSMLLYIWGYPTTPVPPLLVVLVDGLQLLIVAYALVVGAQLVAYAAATAQRMRRGAPGRRAVWRQRPFSSEGRAASASSHDGWTTLREWSVRLADMIWLQEQRGRSEFGPAALAYVRDAVTVELEHRRRAAALERRVAELEARTGQDSVVASERM
jgi:hypothetical protein